MLITNTGVLIASISGKAANIMAANLPKSLGGGNVIRKLPSRPRKKPDPLHDKECACECFTLCDLIYQTKSPAERLIWRNAATKAGTSGYDVWMKECLNLCNANENLPDLPGPGGGWGAEGAVPGSIPAPDSCEPFLPPDEPPPWENPPPDSQCRFCADSTTPLYYTLQIEGPPCLPTFVNGYHTLAAHDPSDCQWSLNYAPRAWAQLDLRPESIECEVRDYPNCWIQLGLQDIPPDYDCSEPRTLPLLGRSAYCSPCVDELQFILIPGRPIP